MSAICETIPVDILIPESWWKPTLYRLQESIVVEGELIPKYFETDGATVPRVFWPVFPPMGKYFRAAALHDKLLKEGVAWRVANRKFKQALVHSNIPKWRRMCMMGSVRTWAFIKVMVLRNDTNPY